MTNWKINHCFQGLPLQLYYYLVVMYPVIGCLKLKLWIYICDSEDLLVLDQTSSSSLLTFMVLSAEPVTNHWFPGSTAMDLTQPR